MWESPGCVSCSERLEWVGALLEMPGILGGDGYLGKSRLRNEVRGFVYRKVAGSSSRAGTESHRI